MRKINWSSFSRFITLCLVIFISTGAHAASTAQAQESGVCACVQTGLDLLGKYKVPPTALTALLPALNDPLTLRDHLQNFGMDDISADNLIADFTPLVREAHLAPGAVEDFSSQGVRTLFGTKIGGAALDTAVSDLLATKGDEQRISAVFTKQGLSDTDAATALAGYQFYLALGFDAAANNHFLKKSPEVATQAVIDKLLLKGVPVADYADIIALRNDKDGLTAALVKLNLVDKDVQELVQVIQTNATQGFDETTFTQAVISMQQLTNLDKALDPDGDGKLGGGTIPAQPKH